MSKISWLRWRLSRDLGHATAFTRAFFLTTVMDTSYNILRDYLAMISYSVSSFNNFNVLDVTTSTMYFDPETRFSQYRVLDQRR
jgi:hypothetical protein